MNSGRARAVPETIVKEKTVKWKTKKGENQSREKPIKGKTSLWENQFRGKPVNGKTRKGEI